MRRGQDAGWGEEGFIDVESCEGTGLCMIRARRKGIYEGSDVPHQFTIRSLSPKKAGNPNKEL
jgi:hypothetical protein